jgi:hypothetical protein
VQEGTGTMIVSNGERRANEETHSLMYSNRANVENPHQLVKFYISSNNTNFSLISRRADGNSDTYMPRVIHGNASSTIKTYKIVDSTITGLGTSMVFAYTTGARYWLRFVTETVSGSTSLQAKVWKDGYAEPDGWSTTVTDSSTVQQGVSGRVGAYFNTSGGRSVHMTTGGPGRPPWPLFVSASACVYPRRATSRDRDNCRSGRHPAARPE